jgi:hypothetical protein
MCYSAFGANLRTSGVCRGGVVVVALPLQGPQSVVISIWRVHTHMYAPRRGVTLSVTIPINTSYTHPFASLLPLFHTHTPNTRTIRTHSVEIVNRKLLHTHFLPITAILAYIPTKPV